MSLLSAIERFAEIDRSTVGFDSHLCLHSRDQFSTCETCFSICPTEAIQPGKPPKLDAEKCQGCLACLPLCPIGAFSADDAVPSLLNCVARTEAKKIDILCEIHSSSEKGIDPDSIGIRIRGCLAGLGLGALLAMEALGLEEIVLRTDNCAQCPWASLEKTIEQHVENANAFLAAWDRGGKAKHISDSGELVERPLWDAENPPLSRRDLFGMVARQGQVAMARAMTIERSDTGRRPGRDRLRINRVVSHLPEIEKNLEMQLKINGFAYLLVSEECNACAACARICPTRALDFVNVKEENSFRLEFTPQNCIRCGMCEHVCAPGAIELNTKPLFSQIFGAFESVVLSEGKLTKCKKCSALFAAKAGKSECSVCEYRRENPFGSMIPPGATVAGKLSGSESAHDH